MLARQYAVPGIPVGALSTVDADGVLFFDKARADMTLCLFEEEDAEERGADSDNDPNEFYDEDAPDVYDECGDVRVLEPSLRATWPFAADADKALVAKFERSLGVLRTSGEFELLIKGATFAGVLPADCVAQTFALSDAHVAVGVLATADAPAKLCVYDLAKLTMPPACVSAAHALNALAFARDGVTLWSADATTLCSTQADAPQRRGVTARAALDVPGIHSMAVGEDWLALAFYPAETTTPRVQVRDLHSPNLIRFEFDLMDDGGMPQCTDAALHWTPRGLVVQCGALFQLYGLD